ncbi:MAG: T9SS type A sorting domain-containing protein, partial [Chitinophagaceae bacterium]|nr:T9SS type A sorting domain-containing protein [Chitinophagaceae bacterium]
NLSALLIGTVLATTAPLAVKSQNLITNSNFTLGALGWLLGGMRGEVAPETAYGGSTPFNIAAEVDAEVGLRQKAPVVGGSTYAVTYKASRRTRGNVPAVVGITVRVVGNNTGTVYHTINRTYSNTVFAFQSSSMSFTIPAGSGDNAVSMEIVAYNNTTSHGVIVDDVEMTAVSASSLPVQWISFTGELRNRTAILNWKTAKEVNNKLFVIERSTNGSRFDSIAVSKAGNSTSTFNQYSYTDAHVAGGTSYYRIRQVDIDGKNSYSKVIIVKMQGAGSEMKVFPTAATNSVNFNMSIDRASDAQVMIVDANGRMVLRTQKTLAAGSNQQTVDVSSLTKGSYYFQVRNNDGTINSTQVFHKVN